MSPTRQVAFASPARSRGATRHAPSSATERWPAARRDLGGLLLQFQRSHGNRYVQRLVDQSRSAPGTAIPAGIKAAVERRSGVDLSGVRVHYNSPWPSRLGALACTQGSEIHVGPGQEKHLAHEAWHVVQQRQGRVRATRNEAGVPVNDDAGLEREAGSAGREGHTFRSNFSGMRSSSPAPVQLARDDVSKRLLEYRKKNIIIDDADWQKLLVIFAKWEEWQQKADACGGKYPASTWRYNATVMITKEVIETLNGSTEISASVRRTLVKLWNKGTATDDQVAFTEPALTAAETPTLKSGVLQSWTPLSPYAERYEYDPLEMMMMSDVAPEVVTPPEKEKERKKERKSRRRRSRSPEKRRSRSRSRSESPEKSKSEKRKSESGSKAPRKEKRKDRPGRDVDVGEQTKQRRKSRTLRTGTGRQASEEDVSIVGTAQEAALIIRSFAKQEEPIPSKFKFMWGPGMFEKTAFQDIVYTSLTETETGGTYARSGSVDSWDKILAQVPERYLKDPARFFYDLQAVLRERQTSDPVLALVAGAMISDVKHGITEWIQLLSELYMMLPKDKSGTDLRVLFKKWYEYSGTGGRDQRRREHRPSYRKQSGRVPTLEWQQPTLIPSRGGFRFEGAGPVPELFHIKDKDPASAIFKVTDPDFAPKILNKNLWIEALKLGDPAFFWNLAMTNKFMYNFLADRWRTTRALMPT